MKFKLTQKVKSIKPIGNKKLQVPKGTKGYISGIAYEKGLTRPYSVKFEGYKDPWFVAEDEITARWI